MVGFGKGSWPLRPNHVNSYNSFIDFPLRGKRQDEIRYDFVVQGVYPGQNKVNKFLLYGAVLGGPKPDDTTPDDHWNVTYTEPTQDYTSAFMMAATGLVQLYNIKRPGQSDCGLDLGWAHPNSSVRARRIYAANDYFHNCRTGSPYSLRHIG